MGENFDGRKPSMEDKGDSETLRLRDIETQKNFRTQNFLKLNFFSDLQFLTKHFFGPNILGPNFFFEPKFLLTKLFF